MLICSARRRQATSKEPDRLRLFPVAWARDEMRSELPTKRPDNLNSGVFNQQPSTHTALWTVDGHLGNWSLKKRLESPQSPPKFRGNLLFARLSLVFAM
jgi:hypothetical protein